MPSLPTLERQMSQNQRITTPYFQQVAGVDFETYYADDYGLRCEHLTMTDYIRHERFEAQTVALQLDTWDCPQSAVGYKEIKELLLSVDWATTAWLSHHTQFDALIGTHHFDIHPCFYLDTMSMSRPVFGVDTNHSHDILSRRFGHGGKVHGQALKDVKNKRLIDMTPEMVANLVEYNEDDVSDMMLNFRKLLTMVPLDELRIIDLTIRMYADPILELDQQLLTELHQREAARREKAVQDALTDKRTLGSSERFADLLRSLGVTPPQKISRRTGQPTYAFARTDLEFKELLEHPNRQVAAAVEARLRTKSALIENRSARLIARCGLPTPVYLAYWAARTGRWGGGDKVNLQNLPSRGDGANLRKAIKAPKGAKLLICDASQIEARMAAWLAGFTAKLDAFKLNDTVIGYDAKGKELRAGPDIYCVGAAGIFGRPIDKDRDQGERFIGKVFELSGQYGAGAVRTKNTFAQGIYGPPVIMDLEKVKTDLRNWRMANQPIIDLWGELERCARRAFLEGVEVEHGPLVFERFKSDGYIHLPNGTFMKYTNVNVNPDDGSFGYESRMGWTRLWGGILLENVCQALCCALLKKQMLTMVDDPRLEYLRIANTVHDECLGVTYEDLADESFKLMRWHMSQTADWCPDIPLNAAGKISDEYEKD